MGQGSQSAICADGNDRRTKLLHAAERCFVESGFHGARMAQIARAAKMSPGLIYHYFESKEQMIAEIIRAHVEEKLAAFERHQAEAQGTSGVVNGLAEGIASTTDPFWSSLTLEITAEATRNDAVACIIREAEATLHENFKAVLLKDGHIPDLDNRVEVFVALIQGLGIRAIRNPDLDREAILPLVRQITEDLFRPA